MRDPRYDANRPTSAAPSNRLSRFWRKLTEPSISIKEPVRRRQARLLASVLVLLTPIGIIVAALPGLLEPVRPLGSDPEVQIMLGAIVLTALIYGLSRTRYSALAAVLAVMLASAAILAAAIPEDDVRDFNALYYLVLPILLGSIFLSVRVAALIAVLHFAGVLLLPLRGVPFSELLVGPLSFMSTVYPTVLLTAHYRNRLERARRARLVESKERLHQIIHNMPVMMNAFDREGNLVAWNRECERVTGYTAGDIIGNPRAMQILHPDETFRDGLLKALVERGGDYRDWEWPVTCKDGSSRTIAWSSIAAKFPIQNWATWGIGVDVTERKHAEDAEREQRIVSDALRDIARILNGTLDRDEVLDGILEHIDRVVPHEAANIMMLDRERGIMRVVRTQGYLDRAQEEWLRTQPFPVAGLRGLQRVIQTGAPWCVADTRADPEWQDIPQMRRVRSYVCAPIRVRGEVAGLLNLDSHVPGYYTTVHAERLQILADQAAVAVSNSQLYAEAQRRLNEQTALLAASTAISSSLDLPTVLHRLAEQIGRAVDATSVYIWDWNDDLTAFTVRADYYGPHARPEERVSDLGVTYRFEDFGQALFSLIQAGKVYALYDDAATPERAREHMRQYGALSVLNVPLTIKQIVIGYAAVWESRRRREFTGEEIALCQAIAHQAAVAIENARLYETLSRHVDQLEQRIAERTADAERERRRLADILNAIREGVAVTRRDWQIEYVNPALERISGYSAHELVGAMPRIMKSGLTDQTVYDDMSQALERGEMWEGEVINRRKDGAQYHALLSIVPLKDASDDIVGYVGTQRNITRMKELDRLKDMFVTNVGHELRTPLANIKLYLELLERGKPGKQDQYMRTLQRETTRLHQLLEAMLDLSRLDLGVIRIQPEPHPLNPLVVDLVMDRSGLALERGLALSAQPGPDLPPAWIDPVMTIRILSNLLNNAMSYTPRDGEIVLATSLRPRDGRDWIVLDVSDNGPGLSDADRQHLFERFYRGEAGRQSGQPGTGLGLAIAREIALKMGGEITVDGRPGQGATFTLWLRPAPEHGSGML